MDNVNSTVLTDFDMLVIHDCLAETHNLFRSYLESKDYSRLPEQDLQRSLSSIRSTFDKITGIVLPVIQRLEEHKKQLAENATVEWKDEPEPELNEEP